MVTREEIVAKAKEMGLTLTEAEIVQLEKDGKLPEVSNEQRYAQMKAELSGKNASELIDMVLDARSEAKEHRLTAKGHKAKADELAVKVAELSALKEKTPELEAKLADLNATLKARDEAEKARRTAILAKLPKEKSEPLQYMLNVEAIKGDQFDVTVDLLLDPKKNGMSVPPPGDPPGEGNPFLKGSKHYSITDQGLLIKSDPEKAKKFQAMANGH